MKKLRAALNVKAHQEALLDLRTMKSFRKLNPWGYGKMREFHLNIIKAERRISK